MGNKIVSDLGKSWIGQIAMDNSQPALDGGVHMHLYTNNYSPTETDVVGDYVEAAYPGYAAVLLTGAFNAGIDTNDRSFWTWPVHTFQATSAPGSPVTVYGVYYTDTTDTWLLWAEEFAGTFTFTNAGDGFDFGPTFEFGSIF